MKWVFLCVLLCVVRQGEGGALRCTPGVQDPSCTTHELEKAPSIKITEEVSERETAPVETECVPGSEWSRNCQTCFCSETGEAGCIDHAACYDDEEEPTPPLATPIECQPNTTFAQDCNTCTCLENGLALCTLRTCRKTRKSTIPEESELAVGKECAAGTFWKSRCNDCGCSPSGFSFCTEKACADQGSEPEMRCSPDSRWRNDCNSCWCTSDGLPVCTKIGCHTIADISQMGIFESSSENKSVPNKILEEGNDETENQDFKIHFYIEHKQDSDNFNTEKHYSLKDLSNDLLEQDLNEKDNGKTILEEPNSDHSLPFKKESHNLLKRSVCKANQIFQSDCNSCKCASDGQSYTCSHNECMEGDKNQEVEVFMESEGVDHIERHSVCKPRGTFYIGCNTCHCNLYGTDYSCTNKPCPLPEDVELFHELRAMKSSTNKTKTVVCVANRMFIRDCNTCWCNDDGTSYFCTRKVCVPELPDDIGPDEKPEDLRIIKKECRPDEVFELDCNMCRCNPDGKSFSCTRRACVDQVDEDAKNISLTRKIRGVTQETPKTCQPGQEFRLDCNKCLCDNEGQDFSCTRNDCNAANNNHGVRTRRDASTEQVPTECSPGSVFDRDCNVCRCTSDGHHALCTIKRCSVPQPDDKEDDVKPEPGTDPNFRCNPGEQFKRGCQDCTCSADGKSVFCTVRLCDPEITRNSV